MLSLIDWFLLFGGHGPVANASTGDMTCALVYLHMYQITLQANSATCACTSAVFC